MTKKSPDKMEYRVLQLLKKQKTHYIGIDDLAIRAKVSLEEYESFLDYIDGMWKEGILTRRKNSVLLNANIGVVKAEIISITPSFMLARPVEEDRERVKRLSNRTDEAVVDIHIALGMEMGALPGDVVMVKPKYQGNGLPEGVIMNIVEEKDWKFPGTLLEDNGCLYVLPDKAMFVPLKIAGKQTVNAQVGDKVLAHVVQRAQNRFQHKVEILQAFGSSEHAKSCAQALLAFYKVRQEFDKEVIEQAKKISSRGISDKELEGRVDLTAEPIFTIDSADSKDLDDAVSLTRDGDNWKLGVHIADVSHYVGENTPLDKEAYTRGTSIYYADQVLPMLPKELSNGICSLNPNEIRLTFSAFITLDASGKILDYSFKKSYIRSRVKGIYKEINAILDGSASQDILDKYADLIPEIKLMEELASLLKKRRYARGAMNLSSSDCKIVIEDGTVLDIQVRQTGVSENIIEEFMLTANEAAATLAMTQEIPFVYRVHDTPPETKVEALRTLLNLLGVPCTELKNNQPETKALAKILNSVRDTDKESLVNNQILRTMSKAVYSERNNGHYGLVLENYAHFTSPIRRYPDLMIHRIMTNLLYGSGKEKTIKKYLPIVPQAAKQSSDTELTAMNIERSCDNFYKAEFMSKRIGQIEECVITAVSENGVFVALANTVSGFVHVRNMPKGSYALSEGIELVEQLSNKHYRIGQKRMVEIVNVNVPKGQVDFVFDDARPEGEISIHQPVTMSEVRRHTDVAKARLKEQERKSKKGGGKSSAKTKGRRTKHHTRKRNKGKNK